MQTGTEPATWLLLTAVPNFCQIKKEPQLRVELEMFLCLRRGVEKS